jgi:hypothetical protein
MDSTNPLRLQQRAPRFDRTQGDRIVFGFEQAMSEAQRRAELEGTRQLVTSARYEPRRVAGDLALRVQAWR